MGQLFIYLVNYLEYLDSSCCLSFVKFRFVFKLLLMVLVKLIKQSKVFVNEPVV